MYPWAYYNGKLLASEEVTFPGQDIGVMRGYGVFDYFRTYRGKPFLMRPHINRLFHSAGRMNLPLRYRREDIAEQIVRLCKKNRIKAGQEAAFRLLLTAGVASQGFLPEGNSNFCIFTEQVPQYPATYYRQGIRVMTHPFLRPCPEAKTTNYMHAIWLEPAMRARQAQDILYYQEGRVFEATRSNFFIISGHELITPQRQVLAGQTRRFVLEMASSAFTVTERDISLQQAKQADEAFITGTSKRVMPVTYIDEQPIGDATVGPKTRAVMEAFDKYTGGA